MTDSWFIAPIVGYYVDNQVAITGSLNYRTDVLSLVATTVGHQTVTKINNIKAKEVFTITLVDLLPYKVYRLRWFDSNTIDCIYINSIKTGTINTMYFVSCDLLEADIKPKHSMWNRILSDLNAELPTQSIIAHLGDQIYGDKVYKYCNNNEICRKQCYGQYLQRYADTFKTHHNVLSNFGNIMIWGDHEVTNNFVYAEHPFSIYNRVTRAAKTVYQDVQESLHTDRSIFISRFNRSWVRMIDDKTMWIAIESTSLVPNISDIINIIKQGIIAHNPSRLIVMFANPPLPPPHGLSGRIYNKVCGEGKFWTIDDCRILYNYIFNWLEIDRKRRAFVVGGDLHFGCLGFVARGVIKFGIAIASPITNQPTLDRKFASKGMLGVTVIDDDDTLLHITESRARRCYVTLSLSEFNMNAKIVFSEDKLPHSCYRYLKTLYEFK